MSLVIFTVFLGIIAVAAIELPDQNHKLLGKCSSSGDCLTGLFCSSCHVEFHASRCVRSSTTNPFKLLKLEFWKKKIDGRFSGHGGRICTLFFWPLVRHLSVAECCNSVADFEIRK
ncbi:hypothetical protein MTR_5g045665 [Medicago truncatula]|uniref:Uncharacterized protein n=1 Tax=Medicago truncatula TaxID=3880 RepID=A0A072UPX2_MEDTR|nr:hypothetical protein MTR_5g045665 [Medicago truncatula]